MTGRAQVSTTADGFTLIEVVVSVAILGIVFTAILGGFLTGVLGSDIHRKGVKADLALRNWAEAVAAADYAIVSSCGSAPRAAPAYEATPLGGGATARLGPSASTTTFAFAVGYTTTSPTVTCPQTNLQVITLTVSSEDGRDTETVQVGKSPLVAP